VYAQWKHYIDPNIEVCPMELPGRGRRINESLPASFDGAVDDLFGQICGDLAGKYGFFGHSLGTMMAWALHRKIRLLKLNGPAHLYVSGRGAPHVPNHKRYSHLTDQEFSRKLVELGGTPQAFFEYPELTQIMLPVLKRDFELSETDLSEQEAIPFEGNLTVFQGKDDDLTDEQVGGWKKQATGMCTVHYFPGGHFFINDHFRDMIRIINRTMAT